MEGVKGLHAEFADDATVVNSDSTVSGACEKANNDMKVEGKWCRSWNMSVLDKTEVMIISFDGKEVEEQVRVYMGEKLLKVVKTKKVLGITLDNKLSFRGHIQEKTKSGFGALRSIDSFVQGHRGCSQSVYMRLYRSLVLPVFEYGAPVWVSAVTEGCKEFGKIQRSAMLKASGCLNSTSTEALEILTNTVPIDLQLKLRQAQEVIRINAKYDIDPLKEEFNRWCAGDIVVGRNPTVFHLLMSRFREMKGTVELDNVEKEFRYTKEYKGLSKDKATVLTEEFQNTKSRQEENVREMLDNTDDRDVLVFTDGSALGNPGPTGAGAVVYLDGYQSVPVLLKKSVSPMSNNYTGELVGIQIALEFLSEIDHSDLVDRSIHLFTDCQPAIITAFDKKTPTSKIEIVTKIKECCSHLYFKGNSINVHWVPGHQEIRGNELADKQAKEAAAEVSGKDDIPIEMDKKEAVSELKRQVKEKWQRKFDLTEKAEKIQEIYTEVGKRNCYGEGDRLTFSLVNQLLSGHTQLNSHRSKIDKTVSPMCTVCNVPEDTEHFLFHCDAYKEERDCLEKSVEEVLYREGIFTVCDINLKVLNGCVGDISRQGQNDLVGALAQYVKSTKRFI